MSGDDDESSNTGMWSRVTNGVGMVVEGVQTVGFLIKSIVNVFD